jgi:hypothetical protein
MIGLRGERVRLVPIDRTLHLENALRWMNDPTVIASLEMNLGITRRQEEAFFERAEGPGDREIHWAIQDEGDHHVGFIGLNAIHWRHRSATGGLVLGTRDRHGRHPGEVAIRLRDAGPASAGGSHDQCGHAPGLREGGI